MMLSRFLPLLLGSACWTVTVSASSSADSNTKSTDTCFSNPQEHPDFVPHLPGFNQPLPSAWFSGYLTYQLEGRTIHTHYVLIESEEGVDENVEETADSEKPLIYWSNGGPGASSLFGLLTELGPLLLDDRSLQTEDYQSTGIPTPLYNPNAWTRLGHLLIIDQPAPVGFSYCDHYNDTSSDTPDDPHSCGGLSWTDELAAANTLAALEVFYQDKFPCLTDSNLYLTGESYAGIYIPTLARSILEQHGSQADGNADTNFGKLQGLAVGDGCLGTETDICRGVGATEAYFDLWAVLFMAGHHQIPLETFRNVLKACRVGGSDIEMAESATGDVCQAALKEVDKEVGGFYEYSLFDDCTYRNGLSSSQTSSLTGAVNDYACGGGIVMQQYINLDAVQDVFHVESEFFEVDNAEGFDYTPTEKDLTGFYKSINGKLRVLVYNGDTDPAITSFAAQNWTSHLDFTETEAWRPWTVDGCRRMGGYVTRYDGDFDFLTIRG
jgi:serine carboxypeptidase-like clade 1